MIGICGCHRTGKTTLAKAMSRCVSEERYVPVEMKTASLLKDLGVTMKTKLKFEERLNVQDLLLKKYEEEYKWMSEDEEIIRTTRDRNFAYVVDRTPIDVAAYLLAESNFQTATNISQSAVEQFKNFMSRHISVTSKYIDMLVYVPIAINVVEENDKAPCNPIFMRHIDFLIQGMIHRYETMFDSSMPIFPWTVKIDEGMTGLLARTEFVNQNWMRLCNEELKHSDDWMERVIANSN